MPPRAITPSQTVGPFFAYALTPEAYKFEALAGNVLRAPDVEGEPIRIGGQMFDGAGELVPDAMVEIWQADRAGLYAPLLPHGSNSSFSGFGRCETNDGNFRFETVKPGAVPGPDGALQAPHINVAVFARGLLKQLFTRLYFEGESLNATDAVLNLVPEHRRHTLVATRAAPSSYVFNIRLQGVAETVFFEA